MQDTRRPHNGDGFGIGYYTAPALGAAPCIFTSTVPAWNCTNLARLAPKTASSLIFAHVRASTGADEEGNGGGAALAEINCHPFRYGALMWMHNGSLGAWPLIKRALAGKLADRWFLCVKGGTDSEWAFALFLDRLERRGVDPGADPGSHGFEHRVLRAAMLDTIACINELVAAVPEEALRRSGIDSRSLLNFAVTDGHNVVCTRYVSSSGDEASSLYFSSGTSWVQDKAKGEFRMERRDRGADIVLVASEPLTFERGNTLESHFCQAPILELHYRVYLCVSRADIDDVDNWVTVPTNSVLTIHKQTVLIHPIKDQFYSNDPAHLRDAAFATDRGLVTAEEGNIKGLDSLSSQTSPDVNVMRKKLEEVQLKAAKGRESIVK